MSAKREGFPTPLLREKVLEIQERVLALIDPFLVQIRSCCSLDLWPLMTP